MSPPKSRRKLIADPKDFQRSTIHTFSCSDHRLVILAAAFAPVTHGQYHLMSTSSINLRNQPGELEKVELQQVQTRLLSAMFRRHDITQRECGWDDTAMT